MTLRNPFESLSASLTEIADLLRFHVDRDEEIRACIQSIVWQEHNVLVVGERGIGKSHLLHILELKLNEDENLFPVFVNLTGLTAYGPNDIASAFPRAVLLQICSELWKRLLKKDYLELRERLQEKGSEISFRSKPEKVIQRIYTALMIHSQKMIIQYENSLGFSAGATGETKGSETLERLHSDILPFEFFEFFDELRLSVLSAHGKKRIVVFCDEAHRLSEFNQHEILERSKQLFSSRGIQFVFVIRPWEALKDLSAFFETIIELKGFPSVEFVKQLVLTRADSSLSVSDDVFDCLYDSFSGHPLHTLDACRRAVVHLHYEGASKLTLEHIIRACADLGDSLDQMKKRSSTK